MTTYLEVDEGNGDEGRDDEKHDKSQEQDTKEGVDLVSPDAVEDVMELDVDGTEG